MKDFGWQGIRFQIPEDWELDAYRGNFNSGYASLDDGKRVRLQLRWIESKHPQLDANVEKYRRSLEKAAKGSLQFAVKAPPFLKQTATEALAFEWRSHQSARGLAYYCASSRRIIMVEVLAAPDWLTKEILRSAVGTRSDGGALWSVYDFPFSVPEAFRLVQADLMPGILRFFFKKSRREWLYVHRWALAAHMTKKLLLERWPSEIFKLLGIAPLGFEQCPVQIGAHSGYEFQMTRRVLLRRARIYGVVWSCPADDRLFAVIANGGVAREVSQQVASSIKCSP